SVPSRSKLTRRIVTARSASSGGRSDRARRAPASTRRATGSPRDRRVALELAKNVGGDRLDLLVGHRRENALPGRGRRVRRSRAEDLARPEVHEGELRFNIGVAGENAQGVTRARSEESVVVDVDRQQ